jgi:hypothetical protein
MGNHPALTYRGGQEPIIHLQADLQRVVSRANILRKCWAFSTGNAGARYADFYKSLDDLDQVNWDAVRSTDFRDSMVKEGKQAEFLLFDALSWDLVEQVGVVNSQLQQQVRTVIASAQHRPRVVIRRDWYY